MADWQTGAASTSLPETPLACLQASERAPRDIGFGTLCFVVVLRSAPTGYAPRPVAGAHAAAPDSSRFRATTGGGCADDQRHGDWSLRDHVRIVLRQRQYLQ